MNHRACVGQRSRNKSIIGKFRNAWSLLSRPRYREQVLCANKLPLCFWRSFRSTKSL